MCDYTKSDYKICLDNHLSPAKEGLKLMYFNFLFWTVTPSLFKLSSQSK